MTVSSMAVIAEGEVEYSSSIILSLHCQSSYIVSISLATSVIDGQDHIPVFKTALSIITESKVILHTPTNSTSSRACICLRFYSIIRCVVDQAISEVRLNIPQITRDLLCKSKIGVD